MTPTSERAWSLFGSMFRPIAPALPTSRRALVGLIAVGSVFFPAAATSRPRTPPNAAPRAAFRSSASNAATCDATVPNMCVQTNVQLSPCTVPPNAGTCGTSVSFTYQYPYHLPIPYTTLDLGNINLPAQAQMRAESQ